jgi:hypothetical protein
MKKGKNCHKTEGMLVVAGLLIGIGVGMAIGKTPVGTLIGLGVGFLAAYIVASKKK